MKTVTASNNQNESYNFDDVGNRTSSHKSTSYGYQSNNKLTSTSTANYNYDANGNMVGKGEGSNLWRYSWDYENRLTTASTRKQTVRYIYDALGRRVQRHLKGSKEITKFIYDGLDVLVDDNSGTLTKYLNGAGIDNKLRVQTGSDVKYFLTDHLGSTNGLADSSGNLTASTNYDSFGNATNANFPTRYQFTGREFDTFTGLHYYRARWYDANLGRFISEDPIGFAGGDVNLFGYVRNQPLIYRDSMGLYPGADVLPNMAGALGGALAAVGGALAAGAGAVASSPAVVGGGGFLIGYGIGYYPGQYIANHPSNPFVNGPLNPFGTPFPNQADTLPATRPVPFPNQSEKCDSKPRVIPRRTTPWEPEPPSDRDGCAEEISACVQLCEEAQYDPNMKHIWGGSRTACLKGCISERCKRGFKF